MNLADSIRVRELGRAPLAANFFVEAKLEVMTLARQGRLLSPHDAWSLASESKGKERLWSISYRIGTANEVPPQEICSFLENQFPQYSKSGAWQVKSWDDVRY